jgi:hypothetical protein
VIEYPPREWTGKDFLEACIGTGIQKMRKKQHWEDWEKSDSGRGCYIRMSYQDQSQGLSREVTNVHVGGELCLRKMDVVRKTEI